MLVICFITRASVFTVCGLKMIVTSVKQWKNMEIDKKCKNCKMHLLTCSQITIYFKMNLSNNKWAAAGRQANLLASLIPIYEYFPPYSVVNISVIQMYNMLICLQKDIHKVTSYFTLCDRIWDVFCELQVKFVFIHCMCLGSIWKVHMSSWFWVLKFAMLNKNQIFPCIDKEFWAEFQMVPQKFHTKYLTHTLKDIDFIHRWIFKSS